MVISSFKLIYNSTSRVQLIDNCVNILHFHLFINCCFHQIFAVQSLKSETKRGIAEVTRRESDLEQGQNLHLLSVAGNFETEYTFCELANSFYVKDWIFS